MSDGFKGKEIDQEEFKENKSGFRATVKSKTRLYEMPVLFRDDES